MKRQSQLIESLQEEQHNLPPSPLQPRNGQGYEGSQESSLTETPATTYFAGPRFEVGYDDGFYIRPAEGNEDIPFDLKIKGRVDFRHNGVKSDTSALTSRNDFELERGRLIFEGHLFDPKLSFYLQTNFETDSGAGIDLKDYYFSYKFSHAFRVSVGQWKVPFSRFWLESSSRQRFADRSMATLFFKPNRSQGIWVDGELWENFHYRAAVTNGINTFRSRPSGLDRNFAYAGTAYWDPLGKYGKSLSDLEWHEQPVVRMGSSFLYSHLGSTSKRTSPGEPGVFRVNDSGLKITSAFPGPAGAGAGFDTYLYAVDFGAKYQGWSFNSEVYFRWLQGFDGTSVPVSKIFDYGYVTEGGYFLIPHKLELIARASRVINAGGSPSADEYSGGFNWFWHDHNLKFTFDVSTFNGSPSSSSDANIRAGEDGLLFRSQLQIMF